MGRQGRRWFALFAAATALPPDGVTPGRAGERAFFGVRTSRDLI